MRACLDCGRPAPATRCDSCAQVRTIQLAPVRAARERDRERPSTTARGYGSEHRKRAALLRAISSVQHAECLLCAGPIDYRLRSPHPLSFAAHHVTQDKHGPMVPAHRVCNEREGQPSMH